MPERPAGDLTRGSTTPHPAKPDEPPPPKASLSRVGGTEGGGGTFVVGLLLLAIGGWLFVGNLHVSSFMWGKLPGGLGLGAVFLPLFVGLALLFFDGGSKLGWIAVAIAVGMLFVGVFSSLKIWFRPTTLTRTLMMLGSLAAGLGLIAKSLRPRA